MTMIASGPADAETVPGATTWSEVERGFWAGSDSRGFLGTIESESDLFTAYDAMRRSVGRFAALHDAQAAVIANR